MTTPESATPAANDSPRWALRLVLCLATALISSATAYLCAYLNFRNNIFLKSAQHMTKLDLELLRKDVERHKATTGAWPADLRGLNVVKEGRVRVDTAGQPLDRWGRPFQYKVLERGYALYSYGRDGVAGGTGVDSDLHGGQAAPTEPPPLWEFATMPDALLVQVPCIAAGVVAFPLLLLQARGRQGNRPTVWRLVVANVVTAFFAILAALMIATLHLIPGGH